MNFEDEKDYIMRIIKEMVRALMSVALGKKYVAVEMEHESGYKVSGYKLDALKKLIDEGNIDDAENRLLENIDYGNNDEVAAAALFYLYLSEKNEDFLENNDFSKEEVLEGLKRIIENAGYGNLIDTMVE